MLQKMSLDVLYEQGLEQGIQNQKTEMILKAHKKGMKINEIAEMFDFEMEYIKNIVEKSKK